MLLRIFTVFLFLISSTVLKAQFAANIEVLAAYPLYFEKEEIGVTTSRIQKGFRAGAFYCNEVNDQYSLLGGMRFTHHFKTTDSAVIEAYGSQNYDDVFLHGTATSVFNSMIPHFGMQISPNNDLISYRFAIGLGVAWARMLYDLPTYDSLSMQYFNPPWNRTGKYNAERKLVSITPCMMLNFAVNYEFRYFYAYAGLDLTFCFLDYPPTPLGLGIGIYVPFRKILEE